MEYFFVYILRCADGSYYTGHTDNMEKRLSEHKTGMYSGYTKTRLPVDVVFLQQFTSRDEAFASERKIKRWTRKIKRWTRKKKEALISKNWNKISELAKKSFEI